jgi:formylglycine-generating enzyme required for sulfatase activity
VTGVPWPSARAYCKSLGGSLPTEAQWEYAARGPGLPKNPWGSAPADPLLTALLIGNEARLRPVCRSLQDRRRPDRGSGAASASSASILCDLGANALEWTRDPFVHPISPASPPAAFPFGGAAARYWRAVRGLPWLPEDAPIPGSASTYRQPGCVTRDRCRSPGEKRTFLYVGFRCVR